MSEELTISQIIADLKGFGIEENEEILTFDVGGKKINLRISNIQTEDEINALLSAEEFKGHMWIQRVRCEILAHAISWINGVKITGDEIVEHPTRKGLEVNVRIALRDILRTFGTEVLTILWKIFMVHNQKIEDRLVEAFPDSTIMTDFEQRFLQKAIEEMEEVQKEIVKSSISAATEPLEKE